MLILKISKTRLGQIGRAAVALLGLSLVAGHCNNDEEAEVKTPRDPAAVSDDEKFLRDDGSLDNVPEPPVTEGTVQSPADESLPEGDRTSPSDAEPETTKK